MNYQRLLTFLCLLSISACTTQLTNHKAVPVSESTVNSENEFEQHEAEVSELPKVALTEKLLEQLLVMSFAPYAADFKLSAEQALKAAISSKDYRLASYAALTGLRVRDYALVKKASLLWLSLVDEREHSQGASAMLVLAEIGLGNAEAAYQQLISRIPKQRTEDKELDEQAFKKHLEEVVQIVAGQRNAKVGIEIIEKYAQQNPVSRDAALSASYVAMQFKHYTIAERWAEKALALSPSWDEAARLNIDILRRNKKENARVEFIDDFLVRNPKSITMRINRAAELAKQDKYQAALDLMQAVVKDDPDNIPALNYAAALAEHLKNKQLAKKLYLQIASEEGNTDDEVYWSLARLAVQDESYRDAEKYYLKIEDPRMLIRAQLQVANMRYETRGIKAALNALNAVNPVSEQDYIDLANTRHYLLMQEYQHEEAFSAINETMVYLPNNLELRYARSLVAAELQEVETVEEDLRFVIEHQPQNAEALNALGYTLADQTGRLEEAKNLIEQALKLMPDAAHIIDSLGWVLYRLGDLDGAQKHLEQAFEKSPIAEIAAHLGEVYWEQGQPEKAQKQWQKGLKDDAKNPVLQDTIDRYSGEDDLL